MSHSFPARWNSIRTALCHDWLTGMRGGERVLEILCQGFPSAHLYTLIHNPSAVSEIINSHPIHASWLQAIPRIYRNYRHLLPLFPGAMERFAPPDCDLLISTSHCVAKNLPIPQTAAHLCYCFTPMRYAWLFQEEYLGGNPVKRMMAAPVLAWLRRHDRLTSSRVHRFVAISSHVQERIRKFYGRDADIVYPPVDLDRWTPGTAPSATFDLVASALVPYKRLDLAVKAYSRLHRPLKIVGIGSERANLERIAGPSIEFLGWQSDIQLLDLYRNCGCLVFPGEEDFGIVPLEAQACGRPVVAYARGGAMETVREDISGIFFTEQTVDRLVEAVKLCHSKTWDSHAIRLQAERFGVAQFISGIDACISKTLQA